MGGLAGNISAAATMVTIQNSYADCYIWSSASAGGLIGMKESHDTKLMLKDVYAAGFIDGSGPGPGSCYAAGVYGGWAKNDNGSIQNVCIAMSYTSKVTIYDDPLVPIWGNTLPWNATNIYYLSVKSGDKGLSYDQMRNLTNTMGNAFEKKNESNTRPYNLDNKGRSIYPFPGLRGLDHYGDWYTP